MRALFLLPLCVACVTDAETAYNTLVLEGDQQVSVQWDSADGASSASWSCDDNTVAVAMEPAGEGAETLVITCASPADQSVTLRFTRAIGEPWPTGFSPDPTGVPGGSIEGFPTPGGATLDQARMQIREDEDGNVDGGAWGQSEASGIAVVFALPLPAEE